MTKGKDYTQLSAVHSVSLTQTFPARLPTDIQTRSDKTIPHSCLHSFIVSLSLLHWFYLVFFDLAEECQTLENMQHP